MHNEGLERSNKNASIFEPIREMELDHLGRLQFARQLLDRVSEPDCPSTLGLYGNWGVGKTSILNLMQALNEKLEKERRTQPLIQYLDVWRYEISGDLSIPLLVQVRNLIGESAPPGYTKSWRRILGVLAQAGTDLLLRNILRLELGDVKGYVENLKDVAPDKPNLRDLDTLMDDIRDAQDLFRELVQLTRQTHQNRRLVFLIDNLDRCSPENVVRLLESTKNFLDAPGCTWVFAMDSGVIASYIDRKYEGTAMDGNSYLDKIIPEQYHIPPVSAASLHKFFQSAILSPRPGLPSIDPQKIPQLPEVLVPRRLLKTAHRFYRSYAMPVPTGTSAHPDTIFALILLYNTWPAFYERFSSNSPEHVRGILENFAGGPNPIPLHKELTENRSLTHYIHSCFIKGQKLEETCGLLASGMTWLREMGLP